VTCWGAPHTVREASERFLSKTEPFYTARPHYVTFQSASTGKEAPSTAISSEAEQRARERRAEQVKVNTRRWRAGKKAAGLREIRFHAEEGLVKQLQRLGDLFGVFGGVKGSSERADLGKVAALLIADLLSGDLAAYRKVLVTVGVCMKGQESLSAVGGSGTVNTAAATRSAHGTSVPLATPIPQPNRDHAWTPGFATESFVFQSHGGQTGARAEPASISHPHKFRKVSSKTSIRNEGHTFSLNTSQRKNSKDAQVTQSRLACGALMTNCMSTIFKFADQAA
jgi:hypothetical protein